MKVLSVPFLIIAVVQPAAASDLFRCRVIDASEVVAGKMTRTDATASEAKLFNPIVVDTATAVIRVGPTQTRFGDWKKEPRLPTADFVATLPGDNFIRLRLTEQPVQMLYYNGSFGMLSGTCEPVR
jgi:hypothetical protein